MRFWDILLALSALGTTVCFESTSPQTETPRVNQQNRSPKDDFELAFGSKSDSLRSIVSLSLALDDALATSERARAKLNLPPHPSDGSGLPPLAERSLLESVGGADHFSHARQLGCLPHDTAMAILRVQQQQKDEEQYRVVPYLVNKKRNAICVLFSKVKPELKDKFIFSYDIPVSLVIDKQFYAAVDAMFTQNATFQQALGAVPAPRKIVLVAYPYKDDPKAASAARIKHIVESIVSYPAAVFDNFFWANRNVSDYLHSMTSQRRLDPKTASASASASASGAGGGSWHSVSDGDDDSELLSLDSKRHNTWSALFAHLQSHVADPDPRIPRELQGTGRFTAASITTAAAAATAADPCQFKRMLQGMHAYADKVTFPMDYLQSFRDEKLAASCLAFLGARLAMPTLLESGHRGSDIFHIGLEYGPALFNYRARSIPQSKTSAQTGDSMPYTAAGIRGAGQVVGVADTGIDRTSCYFEDPAGMVDAQAVPSKSFDLQYRKVVQYNYIQGQADEGDTASGHGTHVCGTVAGSIASGGGGGGDTLYEGAAPDAKLAFTDMTASGDGGLAVPDSADDLYSPSYAAGARLHSNSWGSNHDGQGYYTNSDSDGWLYDNQEFVALYAAGNEGGAKSYLTSQESQGKNCLSVGAGESPDSIASFSSVGPSYDNRFKPDIVAPGSGTVSAEASGGFGGATCATSAKSGTSMATPACSGNGALIRDYLATQWTAICKDPNIIPDEAPNKAARCGAIETPSGPLIKALLIHSGEKMASYAGNAPLGDAPDSKQGYGMLYLGNALPLPAAQLSFGLFMFDQGSITSDSTTSFTVRVTDPSHSLKVTLSWYDPANQNGISTTALLHDLDLSVTAPDGTTAYWGNHLGEGGNQADRLNNNEQVIVAAPDEGDWTVKVTANSLVQGDSQTYALVITARGYAFAEGEQPDDPVPPTTTSPVPVSTAAPTKVGEQPPSDPPPPDDTADDDHFHHKHPDEDDWHSHKRNPGNDDYLPPSKAPAAETGDGATRSGQDQQDDLSPFEKRLIRAIRGVFAPAAHPAIGLGG